MKRFIRVLVGVVVIGAEAAADDKLNGLDITVYNTVSPEHPFTRVEVWARFDPQYYAFAQAVFKVNTSHGFEFFGSWETVEVLESPDSSRGEVDGLYGHRVDGVVAAQVHRHPVFADSSNPILVWTGIYSTSDFTPRDIPLSTLALLFNVWVDDDFWNPKLERIAPGEVESNYAYIHIVPSYCAPDLDRNGSLDLFDFLEFMNLYNDEHPKADCTGDGLFDLFDFLCFTNIFNEGC
jgi:hypothetical protein